MPKISETFPRKYATGEDLAGRSVTLIIASVKPEQMHPQPGSPPVTKWVIYFTNATRGIVLGPTLARQIAEITAEDDTDHWPGKKITLYPEPMTVAGKPRVAIRARRPTNGTDQPPAALNEEEDDQ